MKRLCAKEALKLVPDYGEIGLGGGETIGYLAENIKKAGKHVTVITPSEATREKCLELGLTVDETGETSKLEIAFDGCDQVDQRLNAYKSAGGIHTQEKIIARMSKEYVLLADETKLVKELGCDIPIVLDIVPEAFGYIRREIQLMGGDVHKRNDHLLEAEFKEIPLLEELDRRLKAMTGVIETSLFYQIAAKALIAGKDGVKIIEKTGERK